MSDIAKATGIDPTGTTRQFRRLSPHTLRRIAMRACALQGLPEDAYDKLPKERRESFERGAASTIAALDALGWRFELPPGDW